MRFGNWTFTSGTFITTNGISSLNSTGVNSTTAVTIGPNATVISSMSGAPGVFYQGTSDNASGVFGSLNIQGLLQLSGAAPVIACAAFNLAGGTIEYTGTNAQTLLALRSPLDAGAVVPNTYGNGTLELAGTGVKTLKYRTPRSTAP